MPASQARRATSLPAQGRDGKSIVLMPGICRADAPRKQSSLYQERPKPKESKVLCNCLSVPGHAEVKTTRSSCCFFSRKQALLPFLQPQVRVPTAMAQADSRVLFNGFACTRVA
jgi:hypothetical protein